MEHLRPGAPQASCSAESKPWSPQFLHLEITALLTSQAATKGGPLSTWHAGGWVLLSVDYCYSQGHTDKLTAKASLASCTTCFSSKWPQQSPPSGRSPHCSEALPTCKMGNLRVLSQTQTWNKRCTGLAQQWLPAGIHNLHKSLHLLSKWQWNHSDPDFYSCP